MNKKFLNENLDLTKWEKSFENSKRDVFKHRNSIVKHMKIQKGDMVADVGAGTGAFIPALSKNVGATGKVHAVEISPAFLKHLRERSKKSKLTNVTIVKGGFKSTNLKTSSIDKLLLVDVYHHLDEPTPMLNDFKKVLKPGGQLIVVDFDKVPGKSRQWVINHLRLDQKGFIKEISEAGFKFVSKAKIPFKENFMLTFEKL